MQRAAAFRRIIRMRFNVWPKSNQPTAIGNSTHGFAADHSRGVEAATAASTHACRKEKDWTGNHPLQARSRNLQKVGILTADFSDQLNFGFARNKNSMPVFMHRLRRVYHT